MANTLTLKPGMSFSRDALVRQLFAAGYIRRSQVEGPGQFSVRGDIVDIYPPDMHAPGPPRVLGRGDRLHLLLRP